MGLAVFIIAVFGIILKGVVLNSLWLWFIVPLGVLPITTAQAVGISILSFTLTGSFDGKEKTDEQRLRQAIEGVVAVLMMWGFGAIANLFM